MTLEELMDSDKDFLNMLFVKLTGREPTKVDRKLLLKTLLIVSMGTGHSPPSVFVPRVVSSITKNESFSIINGLIGGLSCFGTHHLGAVAKSVEQYHEINSSFLGGDLDQHVQDYVFSKLESKDIIYGYGHPLYKKDPRPNMLYSYLDENYPDSNYLRIFNNMKKTLQEKKGIHPNVDSIIGLSLSVLGFEKSHCLYLAFIARSLSMVCHILDEQPEKPFDFFMKNTNSDGK